MAPVGEPRPVIDRSFIRPAPLRPGDRVALVAPAGPVPRDAFEAGARLLAARYELVFDEALFTRAGFLAGDDERRLGELHAALHNRSLRAIFCARGGHGLLRLLPSLDLSALVSDPRPIIGFSDVTALHAACLCAGLASVHGPVVTQLGKLDHGPDDLFSRLEDPTPPPPWTGLTTIAAGRSLRPAEGFAAGGNLEVLTRLLGTPWLPPLDGAVLFLEEVGERPYRIDRLLTHLRLAGVLSRVSAIVIGDLVACEEKDGSNSAAGVIADALGSLPIPVLAGAPFGHGPRNRAFLHGGRVRVDPAAGTVTFLE